jgi:hypothetical protein
MEVIFREIPKERTKKNFRIGYREHPFLTAKREEYKPHGGA